MKKYRSAYHDTETWFTVMFYSMPILSVILIIILILHIGANQYAN